MVADTAERETEKVEGGVNDDDDDDDRDNNGVKKEEEEEETEQARQYAEERKRDLDGGEERVDQKFKALEYLLSQSKVCVIHEYRLFFFCLFGESYVADLLTYPPSRSF